MLVGSPKPETLPPCLTLPPARHIAQARKQKAGQQYAEDDKQADAPRQWTDYTVKFEFPEPTELPPPLLQVRVWSGGGVGALGWGACRV